MTTFLIAGLAGLVVTELIIFSLVGLSVRTTRPSIWFGVVLALTAFLIFLLGISVLGKLAGPDTWVRDWSFALKGNQAAQLALGAAFGVVLGYWASLLLQPNAVFFPPAARRAHNIWGIVLAVILALGIFLPYQTVLLDSVQQVSTPAFEITFQSKQRKRTIPQSIRGGGGDADAPTTTERGTNYFIQTRILRDRIRTEKLWTKLLGYPEIEDSHFDDAGTFVRVVAIPLIDCINRAKDNFHNLSDLRALLAPVAIKLRHIGSRGQRGGVAQDATARLSLLDVIDHSIDGINELLTDKQKCPGLRASDNRPPGEAERIRNYLSDDLLRSLSKRVPYLHIMLADIYRFNKNLDGGILILERAAHDYFRNNPLFVFRLEYILQGRLREWDQRTDLFLSTIDTVLDIDLRIMFQSSDALERETRKKDGDQNIIKELKKIRTKHLLFKHILQNTYAYFAAKALLADDDAKRFISETRISEFVLDNQTFASSKEGSGMRKVLIDRYGAGPEVSNFELTLKSQFLDTLATVKTARVHQRAKNNPFLSTGQISELKRELDEAIDYFNDALSHIKGLAEDERRSFPTSFPTGRNPAGDGENSTQEVLLTLKPLFRSAREEIRANRDLAIYLKEKL